MKNNSNLLRKTIQTRRRFLAGAATLAMSTIVTAATDAEQVAAESATQSSDLGDSAAPSLKLAFSMRVGTGPIVDVGQTGDGRRFMIPLTGGQVNGPRLKGKVLNGGESWLRERMDGHIEYRVRYFIRADNGQIIADQATGFIRKQTANEPLYTRTVHGFEAPTGPYEWLDSTIFVGTVEAIEGGRLVKVYELL